MESRQSRFIEILKELGLLVSLLHMLVPGGPRNLSNRREVKVNHCADMFGSIHSHRASILSSLAPIEFACPLIIPFWRM